MMRESTTAKWKPIIDGYDKSTGTIKQYCESVGVTARMFYNYRKQLREEKETDMKISLLPVTIAESNGKEDISVQINGVSVTYEASSISDHELSRIIRLCRDL